MTRRPPGLRTRANSSMASPQLETLPDAEKAMERMSAERLGREEGEGVALDEANEERVWGRIDVAARMFGKIRLQC